MASTTYKFIFFIQLPLWENWFVHPSYFEISTLLQSDQPCHNYNICLVYNRLHSDHTYHIWSSHCLRFLIDLLSTDLSVHVNFVGQIDFFLPPVLLELGHHDHLLYILGLFICLIRAHFQVTPPSSSSSATYALQSTRQVLQMWMLIGPWTPQ